MLTDFDIDLDFDPNTRFGVAYAFIIDEVVVYTIAAKYAFGEIIDAFTSVEDASNGVIGEYKVSFFKDGVLIDTLQTREIVHAVLLSHPIIVKLDNSNPIFRHIEPAWGYVNGAFVAPTGWV